MNERNDYLWDNTGKPDPEVRDLEQLLGGFRQRRPAPAPRRGWDSLPVRAAALVLLGLAVLWGSTQLEVGGRTAGWKLDVLTGTPRDGVLRPGEWLETRDTDRVRIEVADIGHVEVEPESRVRLARTDSTQHRLELERGTLRAQVLAPPRLFIVDTPVVRAVDLGCAYTLTVDPDGGGELQVTSGYVELEAGTELRSYVPRGASCQFRSASGPGIPYFDDAAPVLRDLDLGRAVDLTAALTAARPRDTLTLWHVLQRVPETERRPVFDRLRGLVPLPDTASDAAALSLDPETLLAWRDAMEWHW